MATEKEAVVGLFRKSKNDQESDQSEGQRSARAQEAQQLLDEGRRLSAGSAHREALVPYGRLLEIAREAGDRPVEAAALHGLGSAYYNLQQFQEALEHWRGALAIWREVGNRAFEGRTLNALAWLYEQLGRPNEALEQFNEALAIAREAGDRELEGAILESIDKVQQGTGA
jgi:tetratricopeptide (TPR) repeat protein